MFSYADPMLVVILSKSIRPETGGQAQFLRMELPTPRALRMLRSALLCCFSCLSAFAATLHVDQQGPDQGDGSQAKPFRTIQQAAELAQPGDTVLVRPGIYRERVAPPRGGKVNAPITYRSATPHGAIVRGSDVWTPTWKKVSASLYAGQVDEALFTDTAHRDGPNPFQVPSSSTPYGREGQPEAERKYPESDPLLSFNLGQVFVDDECYLQEPDEKKLRTQPKSWRYHNGELTIHLADDQPAAHKIELTTKRRLFAPHERQLESIIIEGFVFERCGNQYPTNFWEKEHPEWQQAGMVGTRSGRNWIIRDNVLRFANGIGLDLGNEGADTVDLETGANGRATGARGHLVEGNIISDNGAAGTASYNAPALIIRHNIVERNNRLRFTGKKRWESAGIKLHHPSHSIIEGNLVRDNYVQWGIWCDGGAGEGTQILRNVCVRQGVGIDFEIGNAKPALVEENILVENGVGIRTRESGGIEIRHNLIVGSKTAGIQFSLDRKRTGNWSAAHCGLHQNLLISKDGLHLRLTDPEQLRSPDRKLDGNIYAGSPTEARFSFDRGEPMTLRAWQQAWQAFNGATEAEGTSRMEDQATYTFDEAKLELSVNLGFDPKDTTYPGLRQGEQKVKLKIGLLNR